MAGGARLGSNGLKRLGWSGPSGQPQALLGVSEMISPGELAAGRQNTHSAFPLLTGHLHCGSRPPVTAFTRWSLGHNMVISHRDNILFISVSLAPSTVLEAVTLPNFDSGMCAYLFDEQEVVFL